MEIPRLILDVGMGLLSPSQKAYIPDNDIPALDGKVIIVTGGMSPLAMEMGMII